MWSRKATQRHAKTKANITQTQRGPEEKHTRLNPTVLRTTELTGGKTRKNTRKRRPVFVTTGPYPHSNGVLRITYLGGSARERSMLTVLRHLLAGADFTFWEYYDERGITPALNDRHPGHTVTRAT